LQIEVNKLAYLIINFVYLYLDESMHFLVEDGTVTRFNNPTV